MNSARRLIRQSGFKIGMEIYYLLSMGSERNCDLRGPARIVEFREWQGKLQLRLGDSAACWIFADKCFASKEAACSTFAKILLEKL